jgi:phage anti-repressor protein
MDVIIANAMTEGSDLFQLLRDNMNTEEQALFMDSFKMYLQHGNDDDAFVVNLDDVWEWMGFVKKFNALRLLQKLFTEEKDFITQNNSLLRGEKRVQHGGQNKETILMSVQTFKMLCFQANTEKAKKVREYYIKMEKVMQKYIEKLMIDTRTKLEEELIKKTLKIEETKEKASWERHNALLNAYRNKRLVYIMFIENVEEGMVIKIGSSKRVQSRISKVCNTFNLHNQIKVLHVFPSELFREFENSIHASKSVIKYKYCKRINNHAYSTETYLMKNNNTLKSLVLYIQGKALHYQALTREERDIIFKTDCVHQRNALIDIYKNDPVKLLAALQAPFRIETYDVNLRQLQINSTTILPENAIAIEDPVESSVEAPIKAFVDSPDSDSDDEPVDEGNTEPPTRDSRERKSCGPKVQLYNPSDLSKVDRVICGIFQVLIDMPETSLTQIKTATKNKTVYKGYRWYLIPQDDPDPNRPRDIGGTNELQERKVGFVAMLNLDKTIVERVFRTQGVAASEFTFHKSLMSNAVKYGVPYQGKCWVFWDTLNQSLQNEFLKTNTLPIQRNTRAKRVQRLHPDTLEVLQEYDSITHVYTSDRITSKSIKGAVEDNKPFGGFRWNIMNIGE